MCIEFDTCVWNVLAFFDLDPLERNADKQENPKQNLSSDQHTDLSPCLHLNIKSKKVLMTEDCWVIVCKKAWRWCCNVFQYLLTLVFCHSDTTSPRVCIHSRATTSISYLRTLEKENTLFLRSVDPPCRSCCEVNVVRFRRSSNDLLTDGTNVQVAHVQHYRRWECWRKPLSAWRCFAVTQASSSRWCRHTEPLVMQGFLQTVEIPPSVDVVSIDLEPAAEY